jgi:hypothetical protein
MVATKSFVIVATKSFVIVATKSFVGPMSYSILWHTTLLFTCSIYEMCNIFLYHLISKACILCTSAVSVDVSHEFKKNNKKTGVMTARSNLIFVLREIVLFFYMFSLVKVVSIDCNFLALISGSESLSVTMEHRYLNCLNF